MSQALIDLSTTLDDESLVGDGFEFQSLLDSTPSDNECNFDIFSTFSMGVAGITIPEVTPIGTDQIANPNTLPSTASKGMTPPSDNERVSIPSNDLEASTPREGGRLSMVTKCWGMMESGRSKRD